MTQTNRRPVAVCAAEFWTGATGTGLCDGLRAAGWLVHEIDIRAYKGQPGNTVVSRIMRRIQRTYSGQLYRHRVIDDCATVQPDLFLTVKGADLDVATLNAISAMGITTCNYYPDVNFNHASFDEETVQAYDHFVTTKSFQIDWLEEHRERGGVHFVHHGYCGLVHQPVYSKLAEADYLFDVGYAGNHSRYKADQLGGLLNLLPDLDLGVTGPNWQNMQGWLKLASRIDGRERRNVGFAQFVQRSKINLAFHYGIVDDGWSDLVSTRTFEIPACGGFMLHVDNAEIRELYDVGTEIDVFSSIEEMAEKVTYYLERPDLRRTMTAKAMERTIPEYSYATRAREMLAALGLPDYSLS
ncbi:glycosyltransferase [Altererythrobacter sp. ZODW24]|uniref:CgeB family protein n=1 Tax=Altererythrobacter sp. ZODW24 TaxID=2185142 RepID=UPI0013B40119|nr:glycosyltransferase [Altererythrobacter sp. ZODW24]